MVGRQGPRGTDDVSVVDESGRRSVNQALQAWRQGDCIVGDQWFSYRIDTASPLTEDAAIASDSDVDIAESLVHGFMVATQTCDIVRSCASRPFIEVCPLVAVDERTLGDVRRGRQPRSAFVPGVVTRSFVADLDRVMTVEKAVLAGWERTPGCSSDEDARQLSFALARKRARFAFPDDFVDCASQLRRRLSSKHDKDSPEGRALRRLREIRVRAEPSWDADAITLTLWFIRDEDDPGFDDKSWDGHLEAWLRLMPEMGRFRSIQGMVLELEELTAKDYVESDLLDLDHLSIPENDSSDRP
jgi:hypothetical protein